MNSVVIFPKLRAGNITIQEIGLLHYICGHLKDGIFDQPLPQVAIATNLSAPTIHRLLTRLTASGFLKVIRPSVKTKTGNTPVGYKPIQLVEWGPKSIPIKHIPSEPIPNGMIHKESSISVKLVDGDESTLLDSMGIIPPVEWAPDRIVHRAVLLTLESEERRRQEIERAADYVYLAWGRATRESRILVPKIQPKQKALLIIPPGAVLCLAEDCTQPRVKDGYCQTHQALAGQAKNEAARERQQLTYEANAGLFDDKQQAAEANALARVNKLGYGYLEPGEQIGGMGPQSYDSHGRLQGLSAVRCPVCKCGAHVEYFLDTKGKGGTRFWPLSTCPHHRSRCENCDKQLSLGTALISTDWDSDSGRGSVSIASRCKDCITAQNVENAEAVTCA